MARSVYLDFTEAWDDVSYNRGGVSAPEPTRGLGEHLELPQRGPGIAPAAIAFSAYFRQQNASGSKKNTIFLHSSGVA